VNYLGHVVLPGNLAVAPRDVDTIKQAKYPTTITELRSFLGMCNVYTSFFPSFSKIAGTLTNMLKNGAAEVFEELTLEQQDAFGRLRESLIDPTILVLPREDAPYTLDVDECGYQIGACQQQ
jgi:hypothetical protein